MMDVLFIPVVLIVKPENEVVIAPFAGSNRFYGNQGNARVAAAAAARLNAS